MIKSEITKIVTNIGFNNFFEISLKCKANNIIGIIAKVSIVLLM